MRKTNHILFVLMVLIAFCQGKAQVPRLILQTGNTGRIDQMDISGDGKYLITSFGSEIVHLWNVPKSKIRDSFRHDGRITDIAFSPVDPYIFVSTTTGSIYGWKYLGDEDHFILSGHTGAVNDLAISSDGSTMISCGNDSILRIWDLESRSLKFQNNDGDNPFQTVNTSPDDPLVFAADRRGNLLILNYRSGSTEFYGSVIDNGIRDISALPGGESIILADDKGEIHYVSINPVKVKQSISAFQSLAFSVSVKDSLLVTTGRDKDHNIRLYQITKTDSMIEYHQKYIFENPNDPDFIYGIHDHARSDDDILIIPTLDGNLALYNTRYEKNVKLIRGLASSVNSISEYGNSVVFSTNETIGMFDLSESDEVVLVPSRTLIRHLIRIDNDKILSFDMDNFASIMEPGTFFINWKKSLPEQAQLSGIVHLDNENYLIYRYNEKTVYAENLTSGKTKKLKIRNCTGIQVSDDQEKLFLQSGHEAILVYDPARLKQIKSFEDRNLRTFSVGRQDELLAYHIDRKGQKSIEVINLNFGRKILSIPVNDTTIIDQMVFGPNNRWLFTYARSVGKNNRKEDYAISCWDLEAKLLKKRLEGHSGFINDMVITRDGQMMISGGMDGTIRFWSLDSLKEELIIIPFRHGEWVALSPDGRFDSSPRAMSKIHYIFKNEMLHLDQMKKNFYEPKLVQKILGYMNEPFVTDINDQQYALYPEIRLIPPQINDGFLGIGLKDQGGGVGPVSIRINDKEVVEDIRSFSSYDTTKNQFQYEIFRHPYLKRGTLNKITVEGYNEKGYRISHKRNVYFIDDRKKSDVSLPHLYAIIVGISDYKGNLIDLNYAAKDASDFASAIEMGAQNYLGKDHVHIYSLTTDGNDDQYYPSKENIEKAFTHISTIAQPNDIMLVYLSGHGLDLKEDDEFYYLTAEAENPSTEDVEALKKVAISTSELVYMIKLVPALKQLMIVDACHSGNLAASSFGQDGQLNSKSIKALEFMKDRTGTYILASSEGTEVSYESNALNQGLLTYSLLFGLKGAGLHEGEQIDVTNLLDFVNRNVPELARDIGRYQKPVIKIPVNNTSFQIGVLSHAEREQIQIEPPKPIVIRSHFQKEDAFYDEDHFSSRLDNMIRQLRDQSEQSFIFLDEAQFSNAYSIYGRYNEVGRAFQITYRIFNNNQVIHQDTFTDKSLANAIEHISETLVRIVSEKESQ